MTWANLLSRKRSGVSQIEQKEVGRSHFQKDIDRIIFSSAFRRLNHKTQVHPLPENDNIHTRLPHSLEVSSVGEDLIGTCGGRVKKIIDTAKNTAKEKIFNHPRKMQLKIGSHATIATLLDAFIGSAYTLHRVDSDRLDARFKQILNLMGSCQPKKDWSLAHSYLHVLDFISGMTDKYAMNISRQIEAMNK